MHGIEPLTQKPFTIRLYTCTCMTMNTYHWAMHFSQIKTGDLISNMSCISMLNLFFYENVIFHYYMTKIL